MPPSAPRHAPSPLDLALLRGAIEEVPFGIATTRAGCIAHTNAALEQLLGAPPGALEGLPIDRILAIESLARVRAALDEGLVFDGRVEARAFDGRPRALEVHVERYRAADEHAGFLVARDVTPEASALGGVLAQLGGALFRVTLPGVVESVSAGIRDLVGLDADTIRRTPDALVERVSRPERERIAGILARIERGEVAQLSTDVRVLRSPGHEAPLRVHLTARRGPGGRVRHVEGVVVDASAAQAARRTAASLDAARSLLEDARTRSVAPPPDAAAGERAGPAPEGITTLARELLGETTLSLASVAAQAAAMRAAVEHAASSVAPEVSRELARGLAAIADATSASARLTRHVRSAVASDAGGSFRVAELLADLGELTAPLVAGRVSVAHTEAGAVELRGSIDRALVALATVVVPTWLAAGSGVVRVAAHLARGAGHDAIVVDVVAEALPVAPGAPPDPSADARVSATPPLERDARARHALEETLSSLGAALETETWSAGWARASVRFPA